MVVAQSNLGHRVPRRRDHAPTVRTGGLLYVVEPLGSVKDHVR
jgi:hypothetical protein